MHPSNVADDPQIVNDTSFEDGHPNPFWRESSSGGFVLIDQFLPHTGTWDADICGYPGCSDIVFQPLTAPGNVRGATLTFWLSGYCPPNATSDCQFGNQDIIVGVYDGGGNGVQADFTTSGTPDSFTGYAEFSLDVGSFLAARPNQQIFVDLKGTGVDWGGFFIDDVTLTVNDPPTNIVATSPGSGQVSATWSPPPDASTNDVTGYTATVYNSQRQSVQSVTVTTTNASFSSLANGTPYYVGVLWTTTDTADPPWNGAPTNGVQGESNSVTPFSGNAAPTQATAVSTNQYFLPNSDGSTWQRMDESNLSLTIAPSATETVLLGANADLWTFNAGFNQDIGIEVTPSNTGAPVLAAWKESGGFAGTFSPNAAFVETAFNVSSGITYRVDVVWKTNKAAIGDTIAAAAGGGSPFSPTRLTYRVLPAGSQTKVSAQQYNLLNSDGATWQKLDTSNLEFQVTPSANGNYVVSANADMWTWNAGFNQDIGIYVTSSDNLFPTAPGQPEAWKESGGFAGTFSPNAAFVQTVLPLKGAITYTFDIVWKTNKDASGAHITVGAGPINTNFSPTEITAWPLPASIGTEQSSTAASTQQYQNMHSDGSTWIEMDSLRLATAAISGISPAQQEVAIVSANADLWTSASGYNQDIGIFVSVDGTAPALVAWKESGGFAGTFSPNAAFVQGEYTMLPSHSYVFSIWWKANVGEGAGGRQTPSDIWAGAGPIGSAYSPTRITVVPAS